MFWNELANGHHYLVATDGDGRWLGYAGLAVAAAGRGVDAKHRGPPGRPAPGHRPGPAGGTARRGRPARRPQTLLEVAADNGPAQRLYATYGFEPIGVRTGYYQPSNTDALVMRRDEDG